MRTLSVVIITYLVYKAIVGNKTHLIKNNDDTNKEGKKNGQKN